MKFVILILLSIFTQCVLSLTTTDAPLTSGPETSGPPTSGPVTSGPITSGPPTSGAPQTTVQQTSGAPITSRVYSSDAPQSSITEERHSSQGSTEATTYIEQTTDGTLSFCRHLIWNATGNDPYDNYPTYPDNGSGTLHVSSISIFCVGLMVRIFI